MRRTNPKGRLIPVLLFYITVPVFAAQSPNLPRGRLIEKVACLTQPDQTYALYLPSTYSPDTPHPILYCFDPGARGRVPVELFREAAERLGYVVVGSNNSRNGPWAPIQEAIRAVWEDTHTRFALDGRRFYTAGMSGGGAPAWALASSGAAGTIVCASVLEVKEDVLGGVSFAFFGIAGLADFNYPYVERHAGRLLELGKPARFETFDGGHAWPPASLASEALLWLELEAMKSGLKPRDDAFMEAEFQRRRRQADSLADDGRQWEAWRALRYLALDFAAIRDVSECQARATAMEREKKVRDRCKDMEDVTRIQRAREGELLRWRAILEGPELGVLGQDEDRREKFAGGARMELDRAISQMKRQITRPVFDRERIASQRVLEGFYIGSLYYGRDLLDREEYEPAATVLEICSEIRENPSLRLDLARAYAGQRKKKKALSSLEKAVEAGFRDTERLKGIPEFAWLRREDLFLRIMSRLTARE